MHPFPGSIPAVSGLDKDPPGGRVTRAGFGPLHSSPFGVTTAAGAAGAAKQPFTAL